MADSVIRIAGADTSSCTPKGFCNGQAYDLAAPCPDGKKFNPSTCECTGPSQCYQLVVRWNVASASAKQCDACPVRQCPSDHIRKTSYEEAILTTNGNFTIKDLQIYPYGSYFLDCGSWVLGTSYGVDYEDCDGKKQSTTRANNAYTKPLYFQPSFYLRNTVTKVQTLIQPYNPEDFFTP